jgi:hypothetical protein
VSRSARAPADPRGRHVRIYVGLLNSAAWRCLGWSARSLFVDLREQLTSFTNGRIVATLPALKHRGWRSSSTLSNALAQLQAAGFIAVTKKGGVIRGSREASCYRFTDEPMVALPKFNQCALPATNDFEVRHKGLSLAETRRAIEAEVVRIHAEAAAKAPPAQGRKNKTLRNSKRDASEIEAVKAFDDSNSEVVADSLLRKPKQARIRKSAAKPHQSLN